MVGIPHGVWTVTQVEQQTLPDAQRALGPQKLQGGGRPYTF